VSKRSIFIDSLSHPISNAFLNLIPNVFSLLQALWQARWPVAAEGGDPSVALKFLLQVCALISSALG
jgi:hypothetical protein